MVFFENYALIGLGPFTFPESGFGVDTTNIENLLRGARFSPEMRIAPAVPNVLDLSVQSTRIALRES